MGLETAALVLGGIGTAVQVAGQLQQAQAAKASADYQSKVAEGNAQIARQNASYAAAEGEAQTAQKEQQTRAQMGEIESGQASSGVDINSGTSSAVRASHGELGQLDAQTIKSNAVRRAYGFQTEATNFDNQAAADKSQGKNAETAGYINAGASLLSGAGNAATNYAKAMNYGSGISDSAFKLNDSGYGNAAYSSIENSADF